MRVRLLLIACLLALALPVGLGPGTTPARAATDRPVMAFSYPWYEPRDWASAEISVQYFERVRMEYHPENSDPQYQVLLGQFGRHLHPADPRVSPVPGATYFEQTGHNVTRQAFMAYWNANGGLAQFGLPISEEFTETLEDGQPYMVQYFERARFEWRPEQADPRYRVLLGQFGRRILGERH